jgi:hypothetical protein
MTTKRMTESDRYWMWWAILTLVTFGVFEAHAFITKQPVRTLTHTTRKALGIHPKKPRRYVLVPLLGAFLAWLFAHMLTGKFGIKIKGGLS